MSHPNSKISQSGNLCIIYGADDRVCQNYATADGGMYWKVMGTGEESSITGKTLSVNHCMYVLGSVYGTLAEKCRAFGGTPNGSKCENITSVPQGQDFREYVKTVFDNWEVGSTSCETVNGRITQCNVSFIYNIDRTGHTYVGNDIRGTCFDNMVVTQPTGNCVCKENWGYISAYSCAPCESDNRFIAGSCQ